MLRIEFSSQASSEYSEIGEYIAKSNLFYANEVLNKIDNSIEVLLSFPLIGKEIQSGIRIIVEPTYSFKIVYEIKNDFIYIISIFKYKNSWE